MSRDNATGWRWELEYAWGVLKALLVGLAVLVALVGMVGYRTAPKMPPLPPGYVCAAGDMDLRCPAGKEWARSGLSATDWSARHP